ncbi:hypothetical protein B0H67DRAFT_646513 [Lasiosphaeris hirsuta]|uniref:DRBM domain-containing protein n=1 Tax=Lasiosphaeris hirsuta TaxID=260670 RepID=A0AA40DT87_9PEZI|nr:hypothetical protein B0H67DRAFT_646513 [Lasiosphaeris hirsuta]
MPSASLLSDPVDYRDLKEWIAHQESLPQPTPLTDAQRKAIAELKASIIKNVPEPELGETDWVSLLFRFRDANHEDNAAVSFRDEAGPNGTWRCFCSYTGPGSHEPTEFPNKDSGFIADSRNTPVAPGFAKKKDAKKYAARCCAEWLMKVELLSPKGEVLRRRKGSSVATPPPSIPATPSKAQAAARPSASASSPSPPASDDSDNERPAAERVRDLCKHLGIIQPKYHVVSTATSAPGNALFFDGRADFGTDAVTVPETVGRVTACLSRASTKERIAEEVLVYLIEEKARREEQFRAVAGGGAADATDDDDDHGGSLDESTGSDE